MHYSDVLLISHDPAGSGVLMYFGKVRANQLISAAKSLRETRGN